MTDIRTWMASTHRELRQRADGGSVVLRRRYSEPIEDVWSACTDRDRLGRWFGNVTGALQLGAIVVVEIGRAETLACRILQCDPPHRLTVTSTYGKMTPDEVELRLMKDGDGTVLELEHRSAHTAVWATGVGPGWEDWLFRLSIMLGGGDGRAVSSDDIQPLLEPLWVVVRLE